MVFLLERKTHVLGCEVKGLLGMMRLIAVEIFL